MDQREKKNQHNTNHLDQEKIRDLQLTCRSNGGKKKQHSTKHSSKGDKKLKSCLVLRRKKAVSINKN